MAQDELYDQIKALPKIELHRHLEGSIRLETLFDMVREHNISVPAKTVEELRPFVQIVPSDPPSSARFLEKFDILRMFYRTPEFIRRITYEAIEDAANDNVKYMELRFTPKALANTMGFDLQDVTDWVIEATYDASQKFDIQVQLIVSMNRHEPVELGEKVANIAVSRMPKGIVGLDLAGNEAHFSVKPFAPIFREARQAGLEITVHAGEWAGADSVRDAIELAGAQRIGHGVRIIEDPDVVAMARERNIALEVCLTSNLQSGVVGKLGDHPFKELYRVPLVTTINTDDPTVSDITLTDELYIAAKTLGLGLTDLKHNILHAAEVAFVRDDHRRYLLETFEKALAGSTPA